MIGSLSLAVAGLYNLALMVTLAASEFFQSYTARVFFAQAADGLAKGQGRADTYYAPLRVLRPLFGFACGGGLTFGEAFFRIVFDERYAAAGGYFTILVIAPILSLFSLPAGQMHVALGHPKRVFWSDILRIVWLGAVALPAFRFAGLEGLLYAVSTIEVLPMLFFTAYLAREDVFRPARELPTLAAIGAGALAGAAMTAAAVGLGF